LSEIELNEDALTAAHVAIEDVLIELRDACIGVLGPANGFVVKNRDGQPNHAGRRGEGAGRARLPGLLQVDRRGQADHPERTDDLMREYPKIYGPYNRHTEGPLRNKLIEGQWSRPEIGYLANLPWHFTEKVDGTNIRVHWDGHRVEFGGRTDNAQIPAKLIAVLRELFPEELFEQQFGGDVVTLYGEGFGAGIQKGGGNYRPTPSFVLFDVRVGDWWLLRPSVEDVAVKMGVAVVPLVLTGPIHDAIEAVRAGVRSAWGDFPAEGLVGVTAAGLLDRAGQRVMVKVKTADFAGARREAATYG
jgi:hypothetical protein